MQKRMGATAVGGNNDDSEKGRRKRKGVDIHVYENFSDQLR